MELRIVSFSLNLLSMLIHAALFVFVFVQVVVYPINSSHNNNSSAHRRQSSNKQLPPESSIPRKKAPSLLQRLKESSNLVKMQLWYMGSVVFHTSFLIIADWTTVSEVQCAILRKYITASELGILFILCLFMYFKAMTVSIEDNERRKIQLLIKACLAGLPVSATLAPFLANGVMIDGHCAHEIDWIFSLAGLAGFGSISVIYTYWFVKPILETYKNRKRLEQAKGRTPSKDLTNNSSETFAANHVRSSVLKVVWLNFISCMIVTSAVGLWMIYMTVVMTIYKETWKPKFLIGAMSSIAAIFSALSLLICTMSSYRCGKCTPGTGSDRDSQARQRGPSAGNNAPSSPTAQAQATEPVALEQVSSV